MELLKKSNGNISRTPEQIENMIDEASVHYGNFLKAVGFDFTADKQTENTPRRVAKAWLKDLIVGSVSNEPNITTFPNDENYDGLVIQSGIPITSMCAHHNLAFTGFATVAYIPGEKVIGLVETLDKSNKLYHLLTDTNYFYINNTQISHYD